MKFIVSSFIAVVITTLSSLALSNTLSADRGDVSDVLAVIQKWAELEDDLEAQAELIRDDRVQVGGGMRQSNQAENLAVQLLRYNALLDLWGGEPDLMVRIEDPLVQIYGNVAVASFMRLFDVAPPGRQPNETGTAWFSMVLVKENDEWKIAHHHVSPAN
jgi:ketosteroid isomerase-like protein